MEIRFISNELFIEAAAVLALCANNELTDHDFRRKHKQEGGEFVPGTEEIIRTRMQAAMEKKRREFNQLRAEEN